MQKRDKHPMMGINMIRAIKRMGMEIGPHTTIHEILTKLRVDVMLSELTKSKKVLKVIIEKPVVSFCYPIGEFDRIVHSSIGAQFHWTPSKV
jgi:peptidoglycan/xylan/chitin deacetylase (PgdA/CDA1 family)